MSWSVSAVGKPAAVKASLAKQFESAKKGTAHIPHEAESVGHVEAAVNCQLDALAPGSNAVQVTANGSASTQDGKVTYSNVALEVKTLYGFAE